jgi:hypothetical protein
MSAHKSSVVAIRATNLFMTFPLLAVRAAPLALVPCVIDGLEDIAGFIASNLLAMIAGYS